MWCPSCGTDKWEYKEHGTTGDCYYNIDYTCKHCGWLISIKFSAQIGDRVCEIFEDPTIVSLEDVWPVCEKCETEMSFNTDDGMHCGSCGSKTSRPNELRDKFFVVKK